MGKYLYHQPPLTLDSHVHGPFAVLDTVVNVGVKPTIPLAELRQYFNYEIFFLCVTALVGF